MIIVLIMCGIPGVGKSTIAKEFMLYCEAQQITSHYVSYDSIGETVVWSEVSFSEIRAKGMMELESILQKSDNFIDNKFTDVVIIDDMMHLHSMRREVYKITRKYNVPQIVVFVDTTLENAFSRNALRVGAERIPDEVVTKMFNQMEPPNSTVIADRHNCTVNGNSIDSMQIGIELLTAKIHDILRQCPMGTLRPADDERPVVSVQDEKQLLSRLDLKLRKICAAVMKEFASSGGAVQLAGGLLSATKTRTLQLARTELRETRHTESVGNENDEILLKIWLDSFAVDVLEDLRVGFLAQGISTESVDGVVQRAITCEAVQLC